MSGSLHRARCPLSYFSNAAFDLVAIGASMGGVNALLELVSQLPPDFPASIAVVLHLSQTRPSQLASLLNNRTTLNVKEAEEGERLRPRTIYLAPPNKHLLVTRFGTCALSTTERVQFVRPSADVLFESVADIYQDRAIGVVLTGMGKDGARGAQAMKTRGGVILAQDKMTATAFDMPEATIRTGCVDFILPLRSIVPALVTLVMVKGAAPFFRVPASALAPVSVTI